MAQMLVTQGLNELKTLDSRIDRAISGGSFVTVAKSNDKKVNANKTKAEFETEAKASYDSINDLIKRRENIKAAIVESNAKTEVEIAGDKMTIAKAIDLKNSIEYKKDLLAKMKTQLSLSQATVNKNNAKMEDKIDELVNTSYGKEAKNKITESDYNAIANPYRLANETSLVDPLKLEKKIEELEDWITDFESNVDSMLQISNCNTVINV